MKRAWEAVKQSASEVVTFAKTASPLTVAVVAGGLGYLIGARSNVRIR